MPTKKILPSNDIYHDYINDLNITIKELCIKYTCGYKQLHDSLREANKDYKEIRKNKKELKILNEYLNGVEIPDIMKNNCIEGKTINKILKKYGKSRNRRYKYIKNEQTGEYKKLCSICKEYKPLEVFHNSKNGCLGKENRCIPCKLARGRERRRYLYKIDINYKKKINDKNKKFRKTDKYQNFCEKRKQIPQIKIANALRTRIKYLLKRVDKPKTAHTEEIIGISHEGFREYIKSTWKPGMTWENYGVGGWHIDHIIPCAAFNLLDPEQQKKCFHYTNMQALWEIENISKGCKLPDGRDARQVFGENTYMVPSELSIIN